MVEFIVHIYKQSSSRNRYLTVLHIFLAKQEVASFLQSRHSMYISVDGDDIGRMLTQKIYTEDDHSVRKFSKAVSDTFNSFADRVKLKGGEVLFCSGDSILFKIDNSMASGILEHLKSDIFTMSIGVGMTLKEAHWALNIAKSLGKARIVHFDEIRESIFGS